MRYDAALAAEAQHYLDLPLGVRRTPAGLQTLAGLWARIQGQPAGSCQQCQYSDYRRDVAAYVREFLYFSASSAMSDTPRKYQLAPAFAGHTFVHEDWGKVVTADNYDDADAEFFRSKGRTDAFVPAGGTESATSAGGTTEVENERPLVPQADLEAEQLAHDQTQEALTSEEQAHNTTLNTLSEERVAHEATRLALASEKQAHAKTNTLLAEVQRQLADAQKQLEKANKSKVTKPVEAEKPADSTTSNAAGTDTAS